MHWSDGNHDLHNLKSDYSNIDGVAKDMALIWSNF